MPKNVDDFANFGPETSLFEGAENATLNIEQKGDDLGFRSTLHDESRWAFLVQLDQDAVGHYWPLLEAFDLSVLTFGSLGEAAEALEERWPSVTLVAQQDLRPWVEKVLAVDGSWRLPPDQVVLVEVENYLEEKILREAPRDLKELGREGRGGGVDLSHVPPADLPVVFKTVLHPAESGEFLSGLGAMLRSRAAREEHLRWQRQRALYPQCMQLASVESRGPLMRLGLDAVLDVTSAAGGAVLRLGESGVSIECLSGLENVRIEKTLDHVRDHLSEDAPRVEWIPLPSNYTKGRRNSLGPQAVVLPLTRVNGKLLWVLVFPGKPTRWRENKLQDVRLILTHLRMASMRIDSVEAGAKAEVRDPWTGLLREEPLLMSMRQRLRDRSSGGLDASARRGEGKAGVSKERVLSLALVVADLDGFTQLNRSEGHLRGGLLIRRLAQRFLQIVANRGILARTGPDEFAVVVDESREVDKELLAQEIWQGVREAPFCLGGGERKKKQHLTVAVGYSAAKGRKVDPSGLLHNARDAVKQAKREGGDRVVGFEGKVRPGWR